jgi:hypothetical protein
MNRDKIDYKELGTAFCWLLAAIVFMCIPYILTEILI